MENRIETYKILDEYPDYCIFRDGVIWNVAGDEPIEIYGTIKHKSGYRNFCLHDKNRKQKSFQIHRLLALAFIPNPNNLEQIDHIDRDTSNNNLENLRWVSRSQNSRNRTTYQINENSPQSGFKYVNWNKNHNKWQGRITVSGKRIYIGIDDNPRILYVECLKRLYKESKELEFECQTIKDDITRYVINNEPITYD
jgi:hypothetical protein